MKLRFDYNFASSKYLASGISAEELETYKERVRLGLSRLLGMVDSGKVGFPKLVDQDLTSIKEFAKEVKGRYNDLIIIGIGGSALGIEALINAILPFGHNSKTFAERGCYPRVWLLDNVDPSKVNSVLKNCTQEDTLTIVISKSGSTVETAANFSIVYDWYRTKIADVQKHLVIITDPDKGALRAFASENNVTSFPILSSIGGRFSILSPVGLVPAALLGMDIDKLIAGATNTTLDGWEQILITSAVYLYFMEHGKSINIFMPYSSRLDKYAEWFCQLWGESLGKKFTMDKKEITFGTTPVKAVGAIDQHSQIQLFREGPLDKMVTFIGLDVHESEQIIKEAFHKSFEYLKGIKLGGLLNDEMRATEAALLVSKVPTVKVCIKTIDEATLGKLFMFYQYVVPIIGLAVNINPFDQPGVEEAKDFAYGLMNRDGYVGKKEEFTKIYQKSDDYII